MRVNILLSLVSLALLVGLVVYSSLVYHEIDPSIGYLRENPERLNNRLIELSGEFVEEDGNLYLVSGKDKIMVKANGLDTSNAYLGLVGIKGLYKKEGFVELVETHRYNYIFLKYPLSLFAFMVFIFIFFKEWRITRRGLECRIG